MKRKNSRGITLIALIVTIIVLVLIAGISIASLTSDNGILRQINTSKVEQIEGTAREQVKLAVSAMRIAIAEASSKDNSYRAYNHAGLIQAKLVEILNNDKSGLNGEFGFGGNDLDDISIGNKLKLSYTGDDYQNACNDENAQIVYTIALGQKSIEISNETKSMLKNENQDNVQIDIGRIENIISKDQEYIAYYANLDSDEEPEGIIYADLAKGRTGNWGGGTEGNYSYDPITGTKDYYISKKDYVGPLGTKDVISAVLNGTGLERFYVMALEDITTESNNMFCFYYNAYDNGISDYATKTSVDFGAGERNTTNMITAWNKELYGEQNSLDVWGVIQNKYAEGWFVPSTGEWTAFARNLGVTRENNDTFGLAEYYYLSSTLHSEKSDWEAGFREGYMDFGGIKYKNHIRLSTIF